MEIWIISACVVGTSAWLHGGLPLLLVLVLAPVLYCLLLLALWVRSMRPVWRVLGEHFPSPPRHWLYGNMHQHPGPGEDGMQWLISLTQKHVKSFVVWYSVLKPTLTIVHPDSMKAILRTAQPKPMSFFGFYRLAVHWLGEGLLLSKGRKWSRNRRLLTPAFHFETLKPYIYVYNDDVDTFIEKMSKKVGEEGGEVEMFSNVSMMTLNIMLRCALSCDHDLQRTGEDSEYVQSVNRMTDDVMYRYYHPIMAWDRLFFSLPRGRRNRTAVDYAHTTAKKYITERQRDLARDPSSRDHAHKDFLDILLLARDEEGHGLTDAEIRAEVDTFLFEGHDTTASAISWTLYALAGHRDAQEQARKEVDDLLEGRDTDHLLIDDLAHLPFLYQCIREAIRVHNPVPLIGRELESEVNIDGVKLKPGTMIDIALFCLHHNEHVWGKDHNEFKPERFSHENIKTMDPFAYVPFSAGPRNCIGQNFAMHEMKIALARILHHFYLDTVPGKRPRPKISSVTRAENGMYLKLIPRNTL